MRHLSVDPEVRRLRVGLRADENHTLQTGSFKAEWRLMPVPEQARKIIFPFAFPFRGENGGIWWDLWNMCFSKTQCFNWFSCILRYRSLNWGPRGRRFKSCIPDLHSIQLAADIQRRAVLLLASKVYVLLSEQPAKFKHAFDLKFRTVRFSLTR